MSNCKSNDMQHYLSSELAQASFKLGTDLAAPGPSLHQFVDGLNLNLATIGCESTADEEVIRGSWRTDDYVIPSPPFETALRQVTSAVIWREASLADTLPPIYSSPTDDIVHANKNQAIWVPSTAYEIDQAIVDSTEGAVWIDPDAAAHRSAIATTNAAILRTIITGMTEQGYPPRHSKPIIRQECNDILDGLWQRGSYHCFPESRVVETIISKAGLHTASDAILTAKRFRSFAKKYGFGLALQRLLPETVLTND